MLPAPVDTVSRRGMAVPQKKESRVCGSGKEKKEGKGKDFLACRTRLGACTYRYGKPGFRDRKSGFC